MVALYYYRLPSRGSWRHRRLRGGFISYTAYQVHLLSIHGLRLFSSDLSSFQITDCDTFQIRHRFTDSFAHTFHLMKFTLCNFDINLVRIFRYFKLCAFAVNSLNSIPPANISTSFFFHRFIKHREISFYTHLFSVMSFHERIDRHL